MDRGGWIQTRPKVREGLRQLGPEPDLSFSIPTEQTTNKTGYDQRVEFFGKEGTLFHENLYPNNVHLWNGKSTGRIDLVS